MPFPGIAGGCFASSGLTWLIFLFEAEHD